MMAASRMFIALANLKDRRNFGVLVRTYPAAKISHIKASPPNTALLRPARNCGVSLASPVWFLGLPFAIPKSQNTQRVTVL